MRTVDDPTIVGGVGVGLRSKFETEILDYVCVLSAKRRLSDFKRTNTKAAELEMLRHCSS